MQQSQSTNTSSTSFPVGETGAMWDTFFFSLKFFIKVQLRKNKSIGLIPCRTSFFGSYLIK